MGLPTVSIFGNINKIETRFSQSGTQITSFQIECSEKDKDQNWENLYIKGAVFGKSAEFVNNWFKDGDVCVATGKLITETYTDKENRKHYEIKLKFPQIEFATKVKSSGDSDRPQKTGVNAPTHYEAKPMPQSNNLPEIDIDESIPF